jgi:hypothetical protein
MNTATALRENANDAWRRARTAEFASLLRQKSPLYQQVRKIVEDVLVGPQTTAPLAELLRQLLRELNNNLSGQGDIERPLEDFAIILRMEAMKTIRGENHA